MIGPKRYGYPPSIAGAAAAPAFFVAIRAKEIIIARNKSPQTFEKRKREMDKKRKRADKMERRLDRNYWKKVNKDNGTVGAPPPADGGWYYYDEE